MYKRNFRDFDFVLFALVAAMSAFGVILIGSATGLGDGVMSKLFGMQIAWVASGLIVMVLAAFVDFRFICKFYIPIYALNIVLLVITLIIKRVTGYTWVREIELGPVSFMPSEFNKIFMLIFLSALIDKFKERINNFWIFLLICVLGIVPFVLIAMQPSLSAALVSVVILLAMLFIGKLSYKYIITGIVLGVIACGFLYYDLNAETPILVNREIYQVKDRILPFFNPEVESESTQTDQAIFAIGSGGLRGKGLYNNTTTVPESSNDFIFTVVASEFGFIGSVVTLFLMLVIVVKCLIISMKSDIFIGKLISGGSAVIFAFQVFVNVGVNTGLLPNTGMAFPFLSSGGSTMWINMCLIGLCINVKMTKPKSMFDD